MSDIAISIENLSKQYIIGHQQERYYTLRDTLSKSIKGMCNLFRHNKIERETIWALKSISFEVKQGEVVGIIGRNGAGKSTLLKVLSRITHPSEGRVRLRGRVGSLLEVGAGFHAELTGRENIYLNGAILGMKKAEIERKFDEIVAFAEVEKFLDTQVKFYSSGMYMRLAFSVAAHLEPEILLVDEVLAVGDAAFQKKCLGKMGDVAKGGRTVLFVSHQMNSIRRLCERAIWLDGGRIQMAHSTARVVSAYEGAFTEKSFDGTRRTEDPHVGSRFLRWEIVQSEAKQPNMLSGLGPVMFRFILQVNKPIRNAHHGIALWNSSGQLMWGTAAYGLCMEPGMYQLIYKLSSLPLRPGPYHFRLSLYDEQGLLDAWDCVPELIIATDPLTHPRDEWAGILNVSPDFEVKLVNDKAKKQ